jgi:hypothetical protein
MPLGYDVKEEATEVKKNLFENRDTFLMLVIAGITGGLLTRAFSSEGLRKESVLGKIGSWFGYGQSDDEYDDE